MKIAAPSAETVAEAASLLRDGKLVAFPTETVYGLGATPPTSARSRRSSRPRDGRSSIR